MVSNWLYNDAWLLLVDNSATVGLWSNTINPDQPFWIAVEHFLRVISFWQFLDNASGGRFRRGTLAMSCGTWGNNSWCPQFRMVFAGFFLVLIGSLPSFSRVSQLCSNARAKTSAPLVMTTSMGPKMKINPNQKQPLWALPSTKAHHHTWVVVFIPPFCSLEKTPALYWWDDLCCSAQFSLWDLHYIQADPSCRCCFIMFLETSCWVVSVGGCLTGDIPIVGCLIERQQRFCH